VLENEYNKILRNMRGLRLTQTSG